MEITVNVPGEYALQVSHVAPNDLSEILALGIREWQSRQGPEFAGLNGLLEKLAQLPEPNDVLGLRPTAELAARVQELLEKSRSGALSDSEEIEWQRLELAE